MEALQGWPLKFGEESTRLCTCVKTVLGWLDNGIPPWAPYCAFFSVCLIALDRHSIVRLVGVRETWRRIFSKIVLKVTVLEATISCQDDHLCDRLKAGIDGVLNGVQAIWDEKLTTEDWGFLLVDANNEFNEINRVGMLWTVRHLSPSGARFVFN